MIYGIGTDICDVARIRQSLQRFGDRFLRRILSERELATFQARSARSPGRGERFVATRFAAKEAFSKAAGMGMRMPMTWRSCEVVNLPSGKPGIAVHGALRDWFEQQELVAHVSVSDEAAYAVATVILERN